uniref:Uncharacterized protein n=1 Tax=Eiseniibacteriota bacterium TaxID=2212470 RepID=A0A832I114_UNCEI
MAALTPREIAAAFTDAFGRAVTPGEIAYWTGKPSSQLRAALLKDPSSRVGQEGQLQALVDALLPKPVSDADLSARFATQFDPTYTANAADIARESDLRTSRFTEDAETAARRRSANRALALAQTEEQLAAGGASGTLANQFVQRQLKPYDQSAEDAARQSARFTYDSAEERRKRLLQNKQNRAAALAGYLSDPGNKYEFSY